ncbi:hypothetical protein F5X99DRAFT_405605 [Biscogniauxia marginata]|nr:hypothetical protein F5X99DRAFT_405605 [Biscogniauxia marginata]
MAVPYLPNEIIAIIISYLAGKLKCREGRAAIGYRSGLATYASVSRTWQPMVERYTFHVLYLTYHRLPDAYRIMQPSRTRFVRLVNVAFSLEQWSEEDEFEHEEAMENRDRYNIELHRDLIAFFHYLDHWSRHELFPGGTVLQLSRFSPSDADLSNRYIQRNEIDDERRETPDPSELPPKLEFISGLIWDQEDGVIHANDIALNYIMTALANVTSIKWYAESSMLPVDVMYWSEIPSSPPYYLEMMFATPDPLSIALMSREDAIAFKKALAIPVNRLLNDFYFSAAEAALQMPMLESMTLEAMIHPSLHSFVLVVGLKVNITWICMIRFDPEDRVIDVFKQFAEQRGRELHVSNHAIMSRDMII